MSKSNDAWGIEVGANAIKAIRLVQEAKGVRLAEYDVLPFKKVLTTPDLNIDEAIQVNLDQFLSRHDVKRTTLVISVPGHAAFARFAKLPPVEPKKIPDIVKFEAVQQIPFPIEQVEWDYQVFTQEDSPDVEVGIFAITRDRVNSLLNNYKAVGLTIHALTLSPVAVYNAIAFDQDMGSSSEGLIMLDIGTSSTDLIIIDAGDLWLRTLPIGGNNFTEALVRAFKLSFPKAEKLKREAGTSKYARQIFQAMRPVFADLVQEVQRSLGYYQSQNRDAKLPRLMGMGSTFRLPGLQKFLRQQLQIDILRPDGFKKIAAEGTQAADFADQALNLVTAYGLAVQGLGLEKINANILPRRLLKQRLWRAKQPWCAAAAALMITATIAAGVKGISDDNVFTDSVKRDDPMVQKVIRQANSNANDWRKIEGGSDPRQRIENLRRVLDYRDLWPKIVADLDAAIASLKPQDALLHADYAAQSKIPRNQRRRIYIDKIEVAYVGMEQTAAPSGRGRGPMTPNYGPGGPGFGPGGPAFGPGGPGVGPGGPGGEYGPMGMLPSSSAAGLAVAGTEAPDKPRAFLVTISGYTPYSQGTQLVANKFTQWLKDNAQRPDRPYKIIPPTSDQIKMNPRGGSGAAPSTPTPAPNMPAYGGIIPIPGRPGAPDVSSASTTDVKALLPTRPLLDEAQDKDWVFQITWKIQMLPPDQARQAAVTPSPAPASAPATKPQAQSTEVRP